MNCDFCDDASIGHIDFYYAYYCAKHEAEAKAMLDKIPEELDKIKQEFGMTIDPKARSGAV